MDRPKISKGKTGIGNFGVGVMPDGTANSLRILIKPDGFHFEPYDFDDVVLPTISLMSPNATTYKLAIGNNGELLIDNKPYVPVPIFESPNGKKFKVTVDDKGILKTEEVTNATGS